MHLIFIRHHKHESLIHKKKSKKESVTNTKYTLDTFILGSKKPKLLIIHTKRKIFSKSPLFFTPN